MLCVQKLSIFPAYHYFMSPWNAYTVFMFDVVEILIFIKIIQLYTSNENCTEIDYMYSNFNLMEVT